MKQLKYFFEHETFGPDFWRREGPADVTILAPIAAEVNNGHPVPYGFNAPNGTYITDVPPQTNFVSPPHATVSKLRVSETRFPALRWVQSSDDHAGSGCSSEYDWDPQTERGHPGPSDISASWFIRQM